MLTSRSPEHPGGDYVTKFNTVMASNDQPMVLFITSGITTNANYVQMSYDGAFKDLTDKIQTRELFVKELTSPRLTRGYCRG